MLDGDARSPTVGAHRPINATAASVCQSRVPIRVRSPDSLEMIMQELENHQLDKKSEFDDSINP